jgi:hypothetical protein
MLLYLAPFVTMYWVERQLIMFATEYYVLRFRDDVKIRREICCTSYICYLNGMVLHDQSTIVMFIM